MNRNNVNDRGTSYHYKRYLAEFENGNAVKDIDYDYDYDEYDTRRELRRERLEKLHEQRVRNQAIREREQREYEQRQERERIRLEEKKRKDLIKLNARKERAHASRLRQLENSRGINFLTCILFCIAAAVVYKLAIGYLDVNSSIKAKQKDIAIVQSDYETLKAMNDSTLEEIDSSIDLKSIYMTAVNELGMVFANENQVIEYENNESSYVRDFNDIPEIDKNNVIDDIISKLE